MQDLGIIASDKHRYCVGNDEKLTLFASRLDKGHERYKLYVFISHTYCCLTTCARAQVYVRVIKCYYSETSEQRTHWGQDSYPL